MGTDVALGIDIVDAMLFVFDYHINNVEIRKISDLLHDSIKYGALNECYVAVHFQKIVDMPDGDFQDLENSKFVIKRTAFRDESSFYTLNERRVQFNEVVKLLRLHRVHLETIGPFILKVI